MTRTTQLTSVIRISMAQPDLSRLSHSHQQAVSSATLQVRQLWTEDQTLSGMPATTMMSVPHATDSLSIRTSSVESATFQARSETHTAQLATQSTFSQSGADQVFLTGQSYRHQVEWPALANQSTKRSELTTVFHWVTSEEQPGDHSTATTLAYRQPVTASQATHSSFQK